MTLALIKGHMWLKTTTLISLQQITSVVIISGGNDIILSCILSSTGTGKLARVEELEVTLTL